LVRIRKAVSTLTSFWYSLQCWCSGYLFILQCGKVTLHQAFTTFPRIPSQKVRKAAPFSCANAVIKDLWRSRTDLSSEIVNTSPVSNEVWRLIISHHFTREAEVCYHWELKVSSHYPPRAGNHAEGAGGGVSAPQPYRPRLPTCSPTPSPPHCNPCGRAVL
jgi:hypothetical protein